MIRTADMRRKHEPRVRHSHQSVKSKTGSEEQKTPPGASIFVTVMMMIVVSRNSDVLLRAAFPGVLRRLFHHRKTISSSSSSRRRNRVNIAVDIFYFIFPFFWWLWIQNLLIKFLNHKYIFLIFYLICIDFFFPFKVTERDLSHSLTRCVAEGIIKVTSVNAEAETLLGMFAEFTKIPPWFASWVTRVNLPLHAWKPEPAASDYVSICPV